MGGINHVYKMNASEGTEVKAGKEGTQDTSGRTTTKRNKDSNEGCEDNVGMKAELGLCDSTLLLIGIISGSGIFISANGVLQYSGSVGLALLVWAISGMFSLVGGFVYAELGR